MHSSQALRALALVLLTLMPLGRLSPAAAHAATPSSATQDYLPTPRHLIAARSAFQISAIAIGAAAGAIAGNILTGGLMTPILAGGLAAAAAAPTGAYISGFLGTVAGSALGALAGRWVSLSPPEASNQNP
jgi:hypothetical protein